MKRRTYRLRLVGGPSDGALVLAEDVYPPTTWIAWAPDGQPRALYRPVTDGAAIAMLDNAYHYQFAEMVPPLLTNLQRAVWRAAHQSPPHKETP